MFNNGFIIQNIGLELLLFQLFEIFNKINYLLNDLSKQCQINQLLFN